MSIVDKVYKEKDCSLVPLYCLYNEFDNDRQLIEKLLEESDYEIVKIQGSEYFTKKIKAIKIAKVSDSNKVTLKDNVYQLAENLFLIECKNFPSIVCSLKFFKKFYAEEFELTSEFKIFSRKEIFEYIKGMNSYYTNCDPTEVMIVERESILL